MKVAIPRRTSAHWTSILMTASHFSNSAFRCPMRNVTLEDPKGRVGPDAPQPAPDQENLKMKGSRSHRQTVPLRALLGLFFLSRGGGHEPTPKSGKHYGF